MYWTLDNRPPTLDELVYQAKQRLNQRIDEIAAEELVPHIPVVSGVVGLAARAEAETDDYPIMTPKKLALFAKAQRRASLKNMGLSGVGGRAALQGALGDAAAYGTGFLSLSLNRATHHPYETVFDMETA